MKYHLQNAVCYVCINNAGLDVMHFAFASDNNMLGVAHAQTHTKTT